MYSAPLAKNEGDVEKSGWVLQGDCMEVMRGLIEKGVQVDSVVTDPPYHLTSTVERFGKPGSAPAKHGTDGVFARSSKGFMGKEWDGGDIAMRPEVWRLCWELLPPGGHLIAFGGTRTFHRMAVAIEDAGFEIRDTLMWLYGTGFPKSHNVANNIDKAAGMPPRGRAIPVASTHLPSGRYATEALSGHPVEDYEPRTPQAAAWAGWGTALKPAWEPIILARKPLAGTVAANVLEHGAGALNIDGCRVPTSDKLGGRMVSMGRPKSSEGWDRPWMHDPEITEAKKIVAAAKVAAAEELGRWPANVVHDGSDEVEAAFAAFGESKSRIGKPRGAVAGNGWGMTKTGAEYADTGTASRFFYSAKASAADRHAGLDKGGNTHPTVKPTDLMRWLVRMVTPPGGVVLDPFIGSGSTGRAALLEGMGIVGIESDPEYARIAEARIAEAEAEAKAR